MIDPDAAIPQQIRRLLAESQKVLGWLDRLADLARDARPDIVERIRRDYDGRLRATDERLAEYRPQLVRITSKRQGTLDSLRDEMGTRAADLEEIGLRHEIGEFDESELKARRAPVERAIATLEARIEREKETMVVLGAVVQRLSPAAEAAPEIEATEDALPAGPEPREREGEYGDELDFLESLSLGEGDRFDAVSAMLDDEAPAADDPDRSDTGG